MSNRHPSSDVPPPGEGSGNSVIPMLLYISVGALAAIALWLVLDGQTRPRSGATFTLDATVESIRHGTAGQ